MEPLIPARARTVLVLVAMVVVQTSLLTRMRVAGVIPDSMLLVAVCVGIIGGPERGAVVGFLSGILFDLFLLTTPVGLSALVYALVGYAVGMFAEGTVRAAWWIPVLTATVASAAGAVLFALAANVVSGSDFVGPRLPVVALVVGITNGVLSFAVLRLAAWAVGPLTRRTALAP